MCSSFSCFCSQSPLPSGCPLVSILQNSPPRFSVWRCLVFAAHKVVVTSCSHLRLPQFVQAPSLHPCIVDGFNIINAYCWFNKFNEVHYQTNCIFFTLRRMWYSAWKYKYLGKRTFKKSAQQIFSILSCLRNSLSRYILLSFNSNNKLLLVMSTVSSV